MNLASNITAFTTSEYHAQLETGGVIAPTRAKDKQIPINIGQEAKNAAEFSCSELTIILLYIQEISLLLYRLNHLVNISCQRHISPTKCLHSCSQY